MEKIGLFSVLAFWAKKPNPAAPFLGHFWPLFCRKTGENGPGRGAKNPPFLGQKWPKKAILDPKKGPKGGVPPPFWPKGAQNGSFWALFGSKRGGYPPLLRKFGNFHGGGCVNRENGHFHTAVRLTFFGFALWAKKPNPSAPFLGHF